MSKPGYFTRPPPEVLAALPDEQLAALTGFAVGRTGYGLIEWEGASARVAPPCHAAGAPLRLPHPPRAGAVDVRGLDLDAVVIIRHVGVRATRNRPPTTLRF